MVEPLPLRAGVSGRVRQVSPAVKMGCRMHRIDYVLLRTDQSLEVVLSSYLAVRAARKWVTKQ